jgi:acetylglutamate kinase
LIEFNKEIVESLIELSCKAKKITTKENNIITVMQENKDLGFVGMPTKINKDFLIKTIRLNEVPVIAPLGLDKSSKTFNINADTAAGSIAIDLKARRLMIISDVEGVLNNEKKLIPEINSQKAKELIDQEVISGGMIPKVNNCLNVASNGVKGVVIIDGRKNHSLLFELLSDKGSGTLIRE